MLPGQADRDEVLASGLNVLNRFPGSDQQQRVAEIELLIFHAALVGDLTAAQPNGREARSGTQLRSGYRLADQRRVGGNDHLRHPDLLRPIGKIRAGQRKRVQRVLFQQRRAVGIGVEQVQQQDVTRLKNGFGPRLQQRVISLDRQQVRAGITPEVERFERPADQR